MNRYKEFFSKERVLIVDDSSVSRISIARGLSELGAISTALSIAESFEVAQSLIASKSFTVLICELDLGSNSGLELIQALRKNSKLTFSAIITKNQSDAAYALAAENDVDIFLRKPFSMDSFKRAFESVIRSRLNLLGDDQSIEFAIDVLQKTQNKKNIYDRLGYRALVNLYEALAREGKKADAYLVLRRLVTTYPINPDRLNVAMRLSIETRHFDDVDEYYRFFLDTDSKSDELIRHTYAALVSSGKASLREGNLSRTLERFKQASLTSGKRAHVLYEIVMALFEAGHYQEADSFLAAYPAHERQSLEFLTLDYLVMSKLQPLHLVLQRGRELLKSKKANSKTYEILIEACKKAGHLAEAESLSLDASRHQPNV
jgi:DNA-binding response OmpR family regulator